MQQYPIIQEREKTADARVTDHPHLQQTTLGITDLISCILLTTITKPLTKILKRPLTIAFINKYLQRPCYTV